MAPAILVTAWLLPGVPLLLAGVFLPVPMLLISAPLAVALVINGLRWVPAGWPTVFPGPSGARRWRAGWGLAGTIAVASGFALWQFLFGSESAIVLRSPGAYLQTGYWIAQHGSLPIPQSLSAFGGAHPGLGFSSIGFFAEHAAVVPSLMSGLPIMLAGGFWVHGMPAAAALGPILGGLAVLAFGGLVGRLAGPQWAPAGALVLAVTLPQQYTSRGAFSETAMQILLFGGLSLVVDALTLGAPAGSAGSAVSTGAASAIGAESPHEAAGPDDVVGTAVLGAPPRPLRLPALPGWPRPRREFHVPRRLRPSSWRPGEWWRSRSAGSWQAHQPVWYTPQRALMGLGGLALGLVSVVAIDGLFDVLPVIPFIGIMVAGRRSPWLPFCIGLLVGVGYGIADAYLLARPFVASLAPLPALAGAITAWLLALTITVVQLLRLDRVRGWLRRVLAARPLRWLPGLGALVTVAALIGLAVRPYLQTVRGQPNLAVAHYVAVLQRLQSLPVDPGRLYAEDTLYWVIWYAGVPAVLLGGFGAALLIRRTIRALITCNDPSGAARNWGLPLAVICWGSAAVLWQPRIAPDQPWASRRLVPLVLPGLIICAIWAAAWLAGRARERGAGRVTAGVVGACCVAALLVPSAATTFGAGLTHSGKGGSLRPTVDGLALHGTGQGEVEAVSRLCAALGPSPSVVIVDRLVAERFTQVIRGMCGVPVGWMVGRRARSVDRVLRGIVSRGRRPVLLAARPGQLAGFGGSPVRVLNLVTTQVPHQLTQPPAGPVPIHYVIWMTAPRGTGSGV